MSIRNEIIDYNLFSDDIEHWLSLKGEAKYNQYLNLLISNKIECTWKNLDDVVRYDKRLLINTFKYLSFFEDYLRALIWNISSSTFDELNQSYFKDVIDGVLKYKDQINEDFTDLESGKDIINQLRNTVSHNKIMLEFDYESCNLKNALMIFKNALPIDYQNNFIKDINHCSKKLSIDSKMIIELNE